MERVSQKCKIRKSNSHFHYQHQDRHEKSNTGEENFFFFQHIQQFEDKLMLVLFPLMKFSLYVRYNQSFQLSDVKYSIRQAYLEFVPSFLYRKVTIYWFRRLVYNNQNYIVNPNRFADVRLCIIFLDRNLKSRIHFHGQFA